jgi:hypothetical protein
VRAQLLARDVLDRPVAVVVLAAADVRVDVLLAQLLVRRTVKPAISSKSSPTRRTITGTSRPRNLIDAASAST